MVTLTLGSRWQEKVEELANLKLEREELKQEVQTLKTQLSDLSIRFNEATNLNKSLEARLQELVESQDRSESLTRGNEECVQSLFVQVKERSERVAQLEDTVKSMQKLVDELKKEGESGKRMIGKLQKEVSEGDLARNLIEKDRDSWKLQFERKSHEFDILLRSKEHSDKHISILVKEKDRLLGKKPEVSPVLSTQYVNAEREYCMSVPQTPSYQETEILRLRKSLAELKDTVTEKENTIAKLQKENWGLINRVRNARK